jgi:hypothetical protein
VIWLAGSFLPAHAVEEKRPAAEKARTANPPTHVEAWGKRVPVVPPAQARAKGAMKTMTWDVAVVGLDVANGTRFDQRFAVSFYVRNHGSATIAQVPYKVGAGVVVPPQDPTIHDVAAGVAREIGPGRDVRATHTVTIPSSWYIPPDTPFVIVWYQLVSVIVDPDDHIDEEDEANNYISTRFMHYGR